MVLLVRHSRLLALGLAVAACTPHPLRAADPVSLTDGGSLAGWMTPDGQPVPDAWRASGNTIHLTQDGPRGGNIVTVGEFGDFELQFWWKIAPRGNSGLKYRVRNFDGRWLGCEYQIIDDQVVRAGPLSKGSTGALYDVYEPASGKWLRPGEFNHARIVVRGQQIQHWLNGQLIVAAQVGSSQWRQRIADSKFADVNGFGENQRGRIMLTDHGSEVWFRDLVLRELPPPVGIVATCPTPMSAHAIPVCQPVTRTAGGSWSQPCGGASRRPGWRLRRCLPLR